MITATRASSPTRPGSATLPRSPTQNAEKTTRHDGHGFGIAWRMITRQADERTTTDMRLMPTATATHVHETASNASERRFVSGHCHATSTATTARTTARIPNRTGRLCGRYTSGRRFLRCRADR